MLITDDKISLNVVMIPTHFVAVWLEVKNDRISVLELTSCFTSRVNIVYKNVQRERGG